MKYSIIVSSRKPLVKRLEQLTGETSNYAGAPTFAYHVGKYTVTLGDVIADDPDLDIITALGAEGFIEPTVNVSISGAEIADTENGPDAQESVEWVAVPADNAALQQSERGISVDRATGVEIGFPIINHSWRSLKNIVSTIYTRGELMSKATRGRFCAGEALIQAMKRDDAIGEKAGAIALIRDAVIDGELEGVRISDDEREVYFCGFGSTESSDEVKAWAQLAARINQSCIERKRIAAKRIDGENEKFSMRIWMTRIGMGGPEYKAARNILYKHLTGHTAFRTQESEQRWRQKYQPDSVYKQK